VSASILDCLLNFCFLKKEGDLTKMIAFFYILDVIIGKMVFEGCFLVFI
jgi:hypothetical protein